MLCKKKVELTECWEIEKADLIQEKENLQNELQNYMKRLSDLEIHTENLELEYEKTADSYEQKLKSSLFQVEQKEAQVNFFFKISPFF